MEETLHIIEDFEKIADEAVNLLSFPLICAYTKEKMPDYLTKILMETHPYILMEDDFLVSDQYQQKIDMNLPHLPTVEVRVSNVSQRLLNILSSIKLNTSGVDTAAC
ncbi:hypothetical protein [Bacillus taeanensis]|uniref:hypothetical protein n=1 Tax=Bacillus taeanensis TaxID=273032 RepID=UPI0026D1E0F3